MAQIKRFSASCCFRYFSLRDVSSFGYRIFTELETEIFSGFRYYGQLQTQTLELYPCKTSSVID
jgi:hypothetical protein